MRPGEDGVAFHHEIALDLSAGPHDHSTMEERAMPKLRREFVLDGYNIALAGILFMSPWLLKSPHGAAAWDAWLTAAAIVFVAFATLQSFAEWEEWTILVLSIWLLLSPWALGFPHTKAMRLDIGIGIAVAFLAALELWLFHYREGFDAPSHQ